MAREDTYILKIEAETGQVDRAIQKTSTQLDGLGKSGDSAMNLLNQATGGATGKLDSLFKGFKQAQTGVKGFNLGLKGTKAAIVSTGIGALVVLLGELIANWDSITKAINSASEETNNLVETSKELVKQSADEYENHLLNENSLRLQGKTEREILMLRMEKTAQQIIAHKIELDNLRTRANEEIKNAQRTEEAFRAVIVAMRAPFVALAQMIDFTSEGLVAIGLLDAPTQLAKKAQDLVQTESDFMTNLLGLQAQDVMDTNAELIAESDKMLKDLESRRDGFQLRLNEIDTEGKETRTKNTKEALDNELELEEDFDEELESLAMNDFRRDQAIVDAKKQRFEEEKDAFSKMMDELQAEKDAALAKDEEDEKRRRELISITNDMRVAMAAQAFQAIEALGKAFGSQDEKDAKKSFKVQKALSLASASMSATEAVIQAYKSAKANPLTGAIPGYAGIQAAIAAAFGVAQVATIARTQYQAPTQPNAGGASRGGGTASAPGVSPQLDLSFLGAGAGQTGFRSYVIASEVSNSQQANQRINDQASLVG